MWRIFNHCPSPIAVHVGNFKFNGEPREPLNLTGSAQVESEKIGLVTGLVKADSEVGTYTYDVFLEGQQPEDPELVINP